MSQAPDVEPIVARALPGFVETAQSIIDALHTSFGAGPWEVRRGIAPDEEVLVTTAEPGRPALPGASQTMPLILSDGRVFGTLAFPRAISNSSLKPVIAQFGTVLATVLEAERAAKYHAARAEDERRRADAAEREALTDPGTKVGNRRAWDRMLAVAEARTNRYGEEATVLVVDLDDLKSVNDRQGHLAGDLYICLAADALTRVTRTPDRVARLGGDEFGVIVQPCSASQARALIGRMFKALKEHGVSASIGMAAYQPDRSIVEAWKEADADMYMVKEHKRTHH